MATLTTEIFSVHGQEPVQEKENTSFEKHASIADTLSFFSCVRRVDILEILVLAGIFSPSRESHSVLFDGVAQLPSLLN